MDFDDLIDWKLILPLSVLLFMPLLYADQIEPRVFKSDAQERCQEHDAPEECLENLETNHDECYRIAFAKRRGNRPGCHRIGARIPAQVYDQCIKQGPEEYRRNR